LTKVFAHGLFDRVWWLSQSFQVGKKHKGLYLRLVIDTGRVGCRWPKDA